MRRKGPSSPRAGHPEDLHPVRQRRGRLARSVASWTRPRSGAGAAQCRCRARSRAGRPAGNDRGAGPAASRSPVRPPGTHRSPTTPPTGQQGVPETRSARACAGNWDTGVSVTLLAPGSVRTGQPDEVDARAGRQDGPDYSWVTAEHCAKDSWTGCNRRTRRLVVPGFLSPKAMNLIAFAPRRMKRS